MRVDWLQDCSRTASWNVINNNDVTPRFGDVTSPSAFYSDDVSRQRLSVQADSTGSGVTAASNSRTQPPRRSILKKSVSDSAQQLHVRRSALCAQQVRDGDRLMPVYSADRTATATTKRVKFCVWLSPTADSLPAYTLCLLSTEQVEYINFYLPTSGSIKNKETPKHKYHGRKHIEQYMYTLLAMLA